MFRYFVFLSTIICAMSAQASAIEKLKTFIATTHSGEANFIQEVLDKKGRSIQQVFGKMQFIRPGKFRWEYLKPFEQIIVGDGDKFWLYDVDLNQVTVKKLDMALGGSPAALLSGSNAIENGFVLRDITCGAMRDAVQPASAPAATNGSAVACKNGKDMEGLEWLEAIPKRHDTSIEKIRMAFNDQAQLVVMELRDSFGHKTVLHFASMERNPKLAPSLFIFVPPPGADVLGDE